MNPLTWIRENQHQMLIFFTVMLMAGFGALSIMSNNVPNQPIVAPEAKPAVTWGKGTYTDLELQEVWRRRLALQVFLSRLLVASQQIDPNYSSDEMLMLASASPADTPAQTRYVESFNVILLAQKARDLGIQVSDDTIDIKLKRFVNLLSLNDMRSIATEVGRDAGMMSYADFRELLKREFLARQTFMLGIEAGLPQSVNPAAAFSYYSRINRKFDCQVLELKVDDYLAKVSATPSEAELQKLFVEGRYRYPTFDGSKPGFKIGNRLKLEYFVADTSAVLNRLAAEIPVEEVRAEYDRLLAAKDPLVYTPPPAPPTLPGFDPSSFPFGLGETVPLEGPQTNVPPANSGDLDLPPAVPPIVPPTTEESTKQGEQGGGTTGTTESGSTSGEQTGGEQTGGVESRQYVSLRRLQDEPPTQEPPTQEPPTQEPPTQEPPTQEPPTQEPPTQEPPTQEPPTQEPPTQEPPTQEPPTQEPPTQEPPTQEPPPVVPPAEPKIRTFEETEREIRQRLAMPKALAQVKAAFDDVNKQLRIFRSDFKIHQSNPAEPPAKPIDYQALAKKHQLIFNATPVVDQATLLKTQLGNIGGQDAKFANLLFGDFDRISQDPFAGQQIDENTLIWITESYPARAGNFDEVRELVVEYWKMGQARELAMADAKAIAAQVGEGQALKAVHSAAVETGAFSWLTSDMFSQGLRISRVTGAESVGEEFMETVTGLDVGKTGTAFNADRTRVYVIQKTANAGATQDELIERFLTSVGSFRDYPFQVRSVLQQREFLAGTKFIENLRDEYQVNFVE
ncbi:MAG: hypothetical protein Q8M16_13870 [Pirellulaceae bacterium]|nr:hypothetical protein [Pirellulaceae bacterium]